MNLNAAQKEAINSIHGNYAVIASAGSGKTTVITKRIENLVKMHEVEPDNILAITFSKKAKENIQDRLDSLDIRGVNVETFHSLALKIIIQEYGQDEYIVWITQWEKEKAVQDICTELNVCQKGKAPYNEIMRFISRQKARMLTPKDRLVYEEDMPFAKTKMKAIYKEYEAYKTKRKYIEFDDFLNMANEILDADAALLEYFRNKFRFVLSDEFQDISMPQSLLLKKLNDTNTMIVGDPLQAIYSFRGGDSKYILNFDKNYCSSHVIHLNTNYRCSHNIVITANALATDIPDSKHKYYVESIASNSDYKAPEYRMYPDEYCEAEWITKKIKSMSPKYEYKDFAILSRTNAQLTKLQVALRDANIPFNVIGGKVFTDLPEIILLLSYLKLSINSEDNSSFAYIYNRPNRWLDKKFFNNVEETALSSNISYYKAMSLVGNKNWKYRKGIAAIESIVNHIKRIDNIVEKIKYIRRTLSIDDYVSIGKVSDDGGSNEQIENMNAFENMASHFVSLENFIYYLNNLGQGNKPKSKNKVSLMTIHKAKGLEYPVVFIIGCNEGLLPHEKNDSIDDEKRLFYVAITRAEKELYLSSTYSYNAKDMIPSRFIKDIKSTIETKKVENI